MPANDNTVLMEGVQIIYRNFSGKEGPFNREGDRNFAVLLDEEVAKAMGKDGWNIKFIKPREGEDEETEPQAFLPVSLKYRTMQGTELRPPRVVLITGRGRSHLDEDSVEMLDWADIVNVDLIVRPYEWTVNGKTGIKAYLQSIYVTIEEDPLEQKYNELSEA